MILQTNDLKTLQTKKHNTNKEIYKELLHQVYTKIKLKNSLGHSQLLYQLSPIIPGKPLINVEHALLYITRKLQYGKFKVSRYFYNTIIIDWS